MKMLPRGLYFGIVTIIFILAALLWLKSWLRAVRLVFRLPGPPALPLLGNVLIIRDNYAFAEYAYTAYAKYGTLIRVWVTFLPAVFVLDPKHLQRILGSTKLTDKNFLYSFLHNFIGDGLITSSGQKWKMHRKYIQPYFHLTYLENFIETYHKAAEAMLEKLKTEKQVKISTYVNGCVLDILHETVLGIPVNDREMKKSSPFNSGRLTIIDRVSRPWLLLNAFYKLTFAGKEESKQKLTLHGFTEQTLEERKRDKQDGKVLPWCFLDMLMEIAESNPTFTDRDILDEACTLMLAGQDSVGGAVAFTLYYLAKYQNVQEKVHEELKDLFLASSEMNMTTLNGMRYLEQCIKEAMRLCPSVPMFARKLSEDVKLDDKVLPAGCNIFIAPFGTHRLPEYYPNPETFDPERFSLGNQESRHAYAYIPFSAGPRNCIGYKFAMLEMKTIVSSVLRKYRVTLVDGYEAKLLYRVTLRAKGGILLNLDER